MSIFKRLLCGSLFVFVMAGIALPQENLAPIDTPREPVATGPLVTATATAKRVRFVSPGTVVQLRLEVYNEAGQKLFDTEMRGGNVLDWHLQDGAGQHLQTGSYACVLTIKSLSGRLSQRVGLVTVNEEKAAVETAGGAQLSLAQQQIIGPVEDNAAFTVLPQSEAAALTAVTHDGSEGHVGRTRGALSFRVGDFFSGKDKEQMRLTEDGRLGIGTSDPQAKLDVAGTIRAERVLIARPGKPGSNQMLSGDMAQAKDAEGAAQPLASGTGTQNRIAKWIDNLGTLGDSGITEIAGNVGIGTNTPGALLDVSNNTNHLQYSPTTAKLTLTGPASSLTANPGLRLDFNADPDAGLSYLAYAHDNISMAYDAYWNGTAWVSSHLGANFAIYKTASQLAIGFNAGTPKGSTFPAFNTTTGVIFSKTGTMGIGGAPGSAKLYVNGNVGIGNTNPLAKLDVTGNINTSTQFNIGGLRVLSISGSLAEPNSNTFAGVSAGASNTSGTSNSFFGQSAGAANMAGAYNSFFGALAGRLNSGGSDNSFFGVLAGQSNMTGVQNNFFGREAGANNISGFQNAFFGNSAGLNTTTNFNSFFGHAAGSSNTTGSSNSFFGYNAGLSNTAEDNNTFVGSLSNGAAGITNATAIGYQAVVTQSNSLVLGSIPADTKVGIGTTAPTFKLHVIDPSNVGLRVETNTEGGTVASFGGFGDFQIDAFGLTGGRFIVQHGGNVGIGTPTPQRKLHISDAMRLQPIASPPASPASGDLYFNASEALCVYVGGAWAKLAGPGTCE